MNQITLASKRSTIVTLFALHISIPQDPILNSHSLYELGPFMSYEN